MKIIEYLAQSNSKQQLRESLVRYFESFGIKAIAFTWYRQHIKSASPLYYDWATKPLLVWHQYYLQQTYADSDRTLESATNIGLPIWWQAQQQLIAAKNNRERRIRQESIEYGIDTGLSLSMTSPVGDIVTLTLHQFQHEKCLANHKDKELEWLGVLHYYFHYLQQFLQPHLSELPSLTRREKQCLQLTAKNWRVEQIAKNLAISERTVNFHLQNANKKLGTNNKYQSILQLNKISN